ncbi:prx-19 [Pristionchus pacificus]|nr:prx-19 [Pristionchus pacificus]
MADEDKKVEGGQDGEAEKLANLLDSALGGFAPATRTTDDELDSLMEAADAKAAQTAAKDFQSMLQQMVAVQEEALKKAEEEGPVPEAEAEESKAMMEAMRELMACSGAIADAGSQEELFAQLEKLGGPEGNMGPMMSMMMQAFVSKDVMYPPLKEMHNEFPAFLEKKGAELDEETRGRYEKQYEIIGEICAEFEKQPDVPSEGVVVTPPEGDSPSDELPPLPESIDIIGRKLVELQSLGYPPAELTGGLPPGFGLDSTTGIPRVDDPSLAAQACSIM